MIDDKTLEDLYFDRKNITALTDLIGFVWEY